MTKTIIAIGGGEIKNKTTLEIDGYVASLAKKHAGDARANALFIGTASHDSMPYFNSFRKTYTSVYDIKAEVALIVYGEMDVERIREKIEKADCIYVGGGDTVYMLEKWKETGIDVMLKKAYNDGKIICGLSAGAICWFTDMYSDSEIMRGKSSEYKMFKGLGVVDGAVSPHYDERIRDFDRVFADSDLKSAYGIENDCALVFNDGMLKGCVSSGGKAYLLEKKNGVVVKTEIKKIDE